MEGPLRQSAGRTSVRAKTSRARGAELRFQQKGARYGQTCVWLLPSDSSPQRLSKKAVIFFYTKNLDSYENQIVGLYGNAQILDTPKKTRLAKFQHHNLHSNIRAERNLSLLFPVPLDADKYSRGKRLVPRVGFTYVDANLAKKIISDEIARLKHAGLTRAEYNRLARIYKFVTGEKFATESIESDEDREEQTALQEQIRKEVARDPDKMREIIQELKSITVQSPETVEYRGKFWKRDNKTIAQLKEVRGYRCQICGISILMRSGDSYVEAAHIKRPRRERYLFWVSLFVHLASSWIKPSTSGRCW